MITKQIVTYRQIIEKERDRLLNIPQKSDFKSWLAGRKYPLDWMKKRFGETLKEITTENLYDKNDDKYETICNMCEKQPPIDEKMIDLEHYCDGGFEGSIRLCKKCLTKMHKELK